MVMVYSGKRLGSKRDLETVKGLWLSKRIKLNLHFTPNSKSSNSMYINISM